MIAELVRNDRMHLDECLSRYYIRVYIGFDNTAPTEEALLECPPNLELKYQNNKIACESGAPMNQSSSSFVEFCFTRFNYSSHGIVLYTPI